MRRRLERAIAAAGGVDTLYQDLADGVSLRRIAKRFDCSPALLRRALTRDAERTDKYAAARKAAGEALADQALDLADEVPANRDDIQKARLQIEARTWLAKVLDPARYGEKSHVTVGLDVGQLHLAALRKRAAAQREMYGEAALGPVAPTPAPSLPPADPAPVVVAEDSTEVM